MTEKNWNDDQDKLQAAERGLRSQPNFIIEADSGNMGNINLKPGDYTNDQSPTFRGSNLTAGQVIEIWALEGEVTKLVGKVKVKPGGVWSLTPPLWEMTYGTIDFVLSVDGNIDYDNPFRLHYDNRSPDAQLDSLAAHAGDRALAIEAGKVLASPEDLRFEGQLTGKFGPEDAHSVVAKVTLPDQTVIRLGPVAVNPEDGSWSLPWPQDLVAEGDYSVDFYAWDAASNDVLIEHIELTLDTTAPDAVEVSFTLHDDFGPVTGAIAAGGKTDDATPSLEGRVENLATPADAKWVEIYDGETLLGSALVDSQGNWSFQSPELAVGEHVLTVVPVDAAGNQGANGASIAFEVVDPAVLPDAPVISAIADDHGPVPGC